MSSFTEKSVISDDFVEVIDDPDDAIGSHTGKALVADKEVSFFLLKVISSFSSGIQSAVDQRKFRGDRFKESGIRANQTVMRVFKNVSLNTACRQFLSIGRLRTVFNICSKQHSAIAVANHEHSRLVIFRPTGSVALNDFKAYGARRHPS